jgi:hypothetical protein
MESNPASSKARSWSNALWMLLLMLGILTGFFWRSVLPSQVIFSNDGPVGAASMAALAMPAGYSGVWMDLNWLGTGSGSAPADIYYLLFWALGPIGSAKFMLPLTLLFLACSAWLFFRRAGLGQTASLFGAVAATLNSGIFSDGCWGLMTHTITAGMNFLALAALTGRRGHYWIRLVLAGFAVGMGVIESADIGALYSFVVAGWVIYQSWSEGEGGVIGRLISGSWRLAVIALCAGVIASQTIVTMVSTQIVGIVGTEQNAESRAERWDWATQWSLPKKEALGIAAPGIFGYRMDTLGGGQYWGQIGRQAGWDEHHQGFPRYTGTGYYAGILVVLLSIWAALQAVQRGNSVFQLAERRWVWFWAGVFAVALLLAFGRHAPFYQFVYALPYFSTIRNPVKYLFFVGWALAVLSALGVEGLLRYCPSKPTPLKKSKPVTAQPSRPFNRLWLLVSLSLGGIGITGWLIYSGSGPSLERFLQSDGFGPAEAVEIARFSIAQAGWAVLFLLLAIGAILGVMRGWFVAAGRRWDAALLLALLVIDLGHANLPWVVYWDYKYKYASNPVIDFLRDNPYEHRVAGLPFRAPAELSLLEQMYRIEWLQQHFYYYNVQSLDIVQMPRQPVDLKAFEGALDFRGVPGTMHLLTRRWQLTNTRYLLGPAGFLDVLNTEVDPVSHRFRYALRFDLVPRKEVATQLQDLTAVPNTNGAYAVFEFTGALPRAKLYSNWEVSSNDQAALAKLASPEFDPIQSVMVASAPSVRPALDQAPGMVAISSYAPTRIVLQAEAKAPAILLLNDRYDPSWIVRVDGKPAPVLRCNFIMRGVALPPGKHSVEFLFRPPNRTLYLAAGAMVVGVILLLTLIITLCRGDATSAVTSAGALSPRQK